MPKTKNQILWKGFTIQKFLLPCKRFRRLTLLLSVKNGFNTTIVETTTLLECVTKHTSHNEGDEVYSKGNLKLLQLRRLEMNRN